MELLPVQPFQETLHVGACAPATLKMLLMYWDLPGKEKRDIDFFEALHHTPELGVDDETFVNALPGFGLEAAVKEYATFDDIKEWLDKKVPVVVDWFTPGRLDRADGEMPDGHYSIVVGLDDSNIYMQDPETGGLRTIARKDFYRVWFDFKQNNITSWDDMVIRWMAAVYKKE